MPALARHRLNATGLFIASGLVCAGVQAQSAPVELLRFIAPTNNAMPIARFERDVLVEGIVRDLGELIAARLGRSASFAALPSKRVNAALASGEADAMCFVMPQWLQGDFNWTRGLIPDASLVAAAGDAPNLQSIHELEAEPLGTVLGYSYPALEAALGPAFKRADVASMGINLRRLDAARVRYALVEKTALQYHLKQQPRSTIRIVWVVERFEARCAFSKQFDVPFAEVTRVVDRLVADGSIERLLARYR